MSSISLKNPEKDPDQSAAFVRVVKVCKPVVAIATTTEISLLGDQSMLLAFFDYSPSGASPPLFVFFHGRLNDVFP